MAKASRQFLEATDDCGYDSDDGHDSQHQSFLKHERVLSSPTAVYQRKRRTISNFRLLGQFTCFLSLAALTVTYITYPAFTCLGFAYDVIVGTWSLGLPHPEWPHSEHPIEFWENIALTYPKAERAKEWSRYYTSGPHLGGKNYSQALWTKEKFEEFGFEAKIESYDMYVNYPIGHRLALLEKGEYDDKLKVKYEAKLEEPILEKDSTSGLRDRIPTFHGYSARFLFHSVILLLFTNSLEVAMSLAHWYLPTTAHSLITIHW